MNEADKRITDSDLLMMFGGEIPRTDRLRFYLDANIIYPLEDLLRAGGVPVSSVYMMGIEEEKADTVILYIAREMGAILVTSDEDLREINARISGITGLRHAGIVLVSSQALRTDVNQLAATLIRLSDKYEGSSELLWNSILSI